MNQIHTYTPYSSNGARSAPSPQPSQRSSAVRESDKQRFAIKPNPKTNPSLDESSTDPSHWLIRANQGHSIKVESENLLKPMAFRPPAWTMGAQNAK